MSVAGKIQPCSAEPPLGVKARLQLALEKVEACRREQFPSEAAYLAEQDRLYRELTAITAEYIRALEA